MTDANYIAATAVFDTWRDDLLTGKAPVLYPVGNGELTNIEIGPGLVTLIGGAPGAGKTALTMQFVIDALRLTPDLRALVCNVGMPPSVLMDRQLARLSGIDLTTIRHRRLGKAHADRFDLGMSTLEALSNRLCFVKPPFDLGNIAASTDDFDATLLVLDYIQRIGPPSDENEARKRVNRTMDYLRQFTDTGIAVMVISAVARSKDSRGRSSYAGGGLGLASFRESSELEFGADDAFILHPDGDKAEGEQVTLKHLKSRHGECKTLTLRFDRARQSFSSEPNGNPPPATDKGKLDSVLSELWQRTPEAGNGGCNE